MKNIILTGFMGAGKSAVGKKLAERLSMEIIDTDDVIEQESGMKISDIFSQSGEPHFRKLEKIVVEEVSTFNNHVIITGGGVVVNKENIENLRKNGIIVYLHTTPEVIYERVKSETHRPLLQAKDPMKKIKELLDYRAQFYANNDIEVDTSNLSVDEVVEEIIKHL
ncbi:MAG: shikimate kinase [Candidatus Hydrothermarchaeales archaeon]